MALVQTLANTFNPATVEPTEVRAGLEWPPRDPAGPWGNADQRTSWYRANFAIFDGDHEEVLPRRDEFDFYDQYITANLAHRIVTTFADLLFGEEININYPEDTEQTIIDLTDQVWHDNRMQATLYEAALDTLTAGDGVLYVRPDMFGERVSEANPITIEPVPAVFWFPRYDTDRMRNIKEHVIAWPRQARGSYNETVELVKMMIHQKGRVLYQLWKLEKSKLAEQYRPGAPLWDSVMGDVPEEIETGVDRFLLSHVPNYRPSRSLFGRSEYHGLHELFSAMNARLTQYDSVLTKHADPIQIVPKDTVDDAGELIKSDIREEDDETRGINRYVEFSGDLMAAEKFIEKLHDLILEISEVSRALIGGATGNGPISGRALKFLARDTLAKVNRKRLYWTKAIGDSIMTAQALAGYEPVRPHIQWQDGLPQDGLEELQEMTIERDLGIASRRMQIMKRHGVSEEDAEQIEQEIDSDMPIIAKTQPIGGQAPPPPPAINLLSGEEGV